MKMHVQGGSDMTGTDLCVNKSHLSRSYLNHFVVKYCNLFIAKEKLYLELDITYIVAYL
jgi:hypothetical protein